MLAAPCRTRKALSRRQPSRALCAIGMKERNMDDDFPDEMPEHGLDADFDEWPDDPVAALGLRIQHDDTPD